MLMAKTATKSKTRLCAENKGISALEQTGRISNQDLSGLSQAALRQGSRAGTDDLPRKQLDRVSEVLEISVCQV